MRAGKLAFTIIATLFLLLPVTPHADWNPGDSYKMHFPQRPDSNGLDVRCRYRLVLADDWNCTSTGEVRDIHFWFSCASDYEPDIELIHNLMIVCVVCFRLWVVPALFAARVFANDNVVRPEIA